MNKPLSRLLKSLACIAAMSPLAANAFYPAPPVPYMAPATAMPVPPVMPGNLNYPPPPARFRPRPPQPGPFSHPSWTSARYPAQGPGRPWQAYRGPAPRPWPVTPAAMPRPMPRAAMPPGGNPWARTPAYGAPRYRPQPAPRYVYRARPLQMPLPPGPMPRQVAQRRVYNPWVAPMAAGMKPVPAPRRANHFPNTMRAGLPPAWQRIPAPVHRPVAYRAPRGQGRLPAWPGRAGSAAWQARPVAMTRPLPPPPRYLPSHGRLPAASMAPRPRMMRQLPRPAGAPAMRSARTTQAQPAARQHARVDAPKHGPSMQSRRQVKTPGRPAYRQYRDMVAMRSQMPGDRRRDGWRYWR